MPLPHLSEERHVYLMLLLVDPPALDQAAVAAAGHCHPSHARQDELRRHELMSPADAAQAVASMSLTTHNHSRR